jgi:hypothetical protein
MKQLKDLRAGARRIAGKIDRELDRETGEKMEARILNKLSRNHHNPPQSQ